MKEKFHRISPQNFPYLKKYLIPYLTSDSYAALALSIDKESGNVHFRRRLCNLISLLLDMISCVKSQNAQEITKAPVH